MQAKSLQFRIVAFFVALLAMAQIVAFFLVNDANLRISRETAAHELATGEKVFQRLIDDKGKQLRQAARVLAADFGFRDAIASRDGETILSALQNHGGRIGAQVVMLSDLDNVLLADTLHTHSQGTSYPFPELLANAATQAATIKLIDGKLYQIVAVPVKAPTVIAWVTMGFAVDDVVAKDLQALSASQVSFLGKTAASWQIFASTFAASQRDSLLRLLPNQPQGHRWRLAGEDFETRLLVLSNDANAPVYALLARSLNETMASFYALQKTLVVLFLGSLALCLVLSLQIARRITQPLRGLALVAKRIQSGDYAQRIDVSDQSEIGQLAGSLAHMQVAIGEREAEISRLAFQDTLTGLPNRVRFNQLLEKSLAEARVTGHPLSVFLLGLDRFQQINDTLGHPVGDRVLAEVGKRLAGVIGPNDAVARVAGDEFALMLPGVAVKDVGVSIASVQRVFDERFLLDGQPLDLRASIGAASFPEHGSDAIDLVRCADIAMYRAKRTNNSYAIYDPSYQTFRQEHLSLLGELQKAIENNELRLYYQPKVNLQTGAANEAEALVRWIHPQRGFIPPGDFIPFAEQTGFIMEVTRWVLSAGIAQAGRWAAQGQPIKLSINIATRDLLDPDLPNLIASQLNVAQLDPKLLCLEITESGFMEDPTHALGILRTLRGMGLGLAIDDYGTGYSSLAYIRQLPVTELKIDRAFVVDLDSNDSDAQIVHSTIDLGHRLGLKVVAEGIETQAVAEQLAKMGCDLAQGYYFAKPMPAEQFDAWLAKRLAHTTSA